MARHRDDEDDEIEEDEDDDEPIIPAGTPKVYVHKKCEGETKMPDEEIEKYLENPFELGEEPQTYCDECEKDVPWKSCTWRKTGENLYDYLDDLRAEKIISGDDPRNGPTYPWWTPLILGLILGATAMFGTRRREGFGPMGGAIGLVVGLVGGGIYAYYEMKKHEKEFEQWNSSCLKRYYKRHPDRKKTKRKSSEE